MLSLLPAVASGASYTSTLIGTSSRVRLDIGLERGSWMPKNIKGWGGSGARVVVSALVDFEAEPANEAEELVGPRSQTRVLNARGGGKIVTFDGEQAVDFTSGGWCVQRPLGAQAGSDEGGSSSGETRSDVHFWYLEPSAHCGNVIMRVPVRWTSSTTSGTSHSGACDANFA
ncbi:hypothetical protein EMIHUDRAFT_241908 [Emiliania huxleyi CCMP1516]|uniref:Uncharacterized protein n=2 Tax=Emiliania huxleyi TaxID=2903 RepID=A0A0D3JB14_EMIH1|nr:hypothetical protein EMIHUDRAFT_241908 [Emiliania huxleyi CCMP1516]EOD20699.1 hypothetical protein EMIHUDRAFT_241908 [Emiliania huxleyi CCMP1516]|eukprot:XP_005773128.1 hypothetical protein EMIHUDRAFT_241908 [Emiliania huxleyi CCMP1516]